MNQLQCACLIALNEHRLLLVRIRDNKKWYLPGGKIEAGESPEQALVRELAEELNIKVLPKTVRYLTTVVGPAYRQPGKVELICFSADWQGEIFPSAEISEVAFLDWRHRKLLAPAVEKLCDEWLDSKYEIYDVLQ